MTRAADLMHQCPRPGAGPLHPLDLPRYTPPVQFEIAKSSPLVFAERPDNALFRYGHAHAYINTYEQARVFGNGFLILGRSLVLDGLTSGNYIQNQKEQLASYGAVPDGGTLSGEYVLVWGSENFGHWLFTYLMRLTLLYWKPELIGLPLLVKQGTPPRFVAWLREMGFSKILYACDGCRIEKLHVPSVVTYRGPDQLPYVFPQALDLLRYRVLDIGAVWPVRSRTRLYLSRDRSRWRKLVNEAEVSAMLARHGIERVFMEDLTLSEQLDKISRAELIVSHCGAGSSITLFAPRDCRIVEIGFPAITGTFASRAWAHQLGQPFIRFDAQPVARSGPLAIDWDCRVNIAALEKIL